MSQKLTINSRSASDDRSVATCTTAFLLKKFSLHKCYFITLNPYKKDKRYKAYQRIGRVSDWLRRHCRSHFVVREYNHTGDCHYHAIATMFDGQKMLGMNQLTKVVGGPSKEPTILTHDDVEAKLFHEESEFDQKNSDEMFDVLRIFFDVSDVPTIYDNFKRYLFSLKDKQMKKSRYQRVKKKKKERKGHLEKVIHYMLKDNPILEYNDWAYSKAKK